MEISTNGILTMDNLMTHIETVKFSPSSITRAVLEHADAISEGKINIVDMTSPMMMLLSAGSAFCASSVHETVQATRNIYPSLATTSLQLYRHMTDKEFVGVFAVPGSTVFNVILNRDDVMNKMVYDAEEMCHKVIFPRDSLFKAGDTSYTLEYPIVIRLMDNGTFKIEYDVTIPSPVARLKTNIINYKSSRSFLGDDQSSGWIAFEVPLRQFDIMSTNYVIEKSIPLKKMVEFPDSYYMSRVHYRNEDTGEWREIRVSHGDYVYDSGYPTALIDVIDNIATLTIPHIYVTSGLISGEIRHDIYYTKGELSERYNNLGLESFTLTRRAIDEERDISIYSNALADINHHVIAPGVATGGRSKLTLDKLRERVINHTMGYIELPITNVQMAAKVEDSGFDLVRNVDTTTNRIFLATRKLPIPTASKLVSAANIGMNTFIPNMDELDRNGFVKKNGLRRTISDQALYVNENGIVRMLSTQEVAALKASNLVNLVTEVNSKQYLYSPYHYVLDDSDGRFDVRAYDLTKPSLSDLNFIEQNQTLNITVNTGAFQLRKTESGYQLAFTTRSGQYYKGVDQLNMTYCQIGFYPEGENKLAHINCVKAGHTETDETIWTVDLDTELEIDGSNRLKITNAVYGASGAIDIWINLESKIHIFHCTNSLTLEYRPSQADNLINASVLPVNTKAITHEELTLTIGKTLDLLWKRARPLPVGQEYLQYTDDIPDRYEADVYEINPLSGTEIFIENGLPVRRKLHEAGEIKLDESGQPRYKYRRGEYMLDENGDLILSGGETVTRELDMLFVDGRYYFVTDQAILDYRTEMVDFLTTWITEQIQALNDVALENTKVFFYPKTTLGNVKVETENQGVTILPSEQSLTVDLYVPERVYEDIELRQIIIDKTVVVLDEYISKTVVNLTEIQRALDDTYGDTVASLNVTNLGGSNNYRHLVLAAEENRMCLKKTLQIQMDNSLIVKEDVTVNFYKVRT